MDVLVIALIGLIYCLYSKMGKCFEKLIEFLAYKNTPAENDSFLSDKLEEFYRTNRKENLKLCYYLTAMMILYFIKMIVVDFF